MVIFKKEETLNVEIRSRGEDMEEERLESKPIVCLDKLKKIMEKELHKSMKFKELKNQKWKNPYWNHNVFHIKISMQ